MTIKTLRELVNNLWWSQIQNRGAVKLWRTACRVPISNIQTDGEDKGAPILLCYFSNTFIYPPTGQRSAYATHKHTLWPIDCLKWQWFNVCEGQLVVCVWPFKARVITNRWRHCIRQSFPINCSTHLSINKHSAVISQFNTKRKFKSKMPAVLMFVYKSRQSPLSFCGWMRAFIENSSRFITTSEPLIQSGTPLRHTLC